MSYCSLLKSARRLTALVLLTISTLLPQLAAIAADGPADNQTETVRRIPKLGLEVPADVAARLITATDDMSRRIDALRRSESEPQRSLWTDVEIFRVAVRSALDHQEFFAESDLQTADRLLAAGERRLEALEQGTAPWTTETGLVVRGYVSELDGSVQPYGLVIPATCDLTSHSRMPLDIWFHGRGETLSELQFLDQRMNSAGQFAPREAIVLHPYGRYCNANKFAGEVDVYESLESVRSRYDIDDDRIAVRGFSMGGASAWQLAVHDPGRWAAANPGAGFAETPEFLQTFQSETLNPYWWERRLWRLYDATQWASNLRHVPTAVSYTHLTLPTNREV